MYIGRIPVGAEWAKAEELLAGIVEGFAFDPKKTYQLTTETISHGIRLCVLDAVPTDPLAGDVLIPSQAAIYVPSDGEYLFCRIENAPDEATLKVSEIG